MTRDRRCYSPKTRSSPLRATRSGPVRTMPGRSRTAVSPRRREEYRDKSNYHCDDRDICIQRLSEFNESLRRGESASTKFRWDQLLVQKAGRVAATHPDYENERIRSCSTSPMLRDENQSADRRSPLGFNPHLSERDLGLRNNGDDFGHRRGLSREDKPIGNYCGGSSPMVPASARVLRGNPGFGFSSGMFSAHGEMGGFDGFGGKSILNPSRMPEVDYPELESYRHVGCGPTKEITELPYGNVVRGRLRDGIVDSSNAETFVGTGSCSSRDDFEENTALSHQHNHCSLSPNYLDFGGGSLVREQDEEVLDSKTIYLQNQKGMAFSREGSQSRTDEEFLHSRMTHLQKPEGVFFDGESQLPRQDGEEVLDPQMIYIQNQDVVGLDRENLQLRKDYSLGSYTLSEHYDHAYVSEGNPRQMLVAEKLITGNHSHKGRIIDLRQVKENQRSEALQNSNALDDIHIMNYGDEKYADENNMQLKQLGVLGFMQNQDWRALQFDELVSQRSPPRRSVFEQGRLSYPINSSTRKSAKERLGLPQYVSNPKPLLWLNSLKRKKCQKEKFNDVHDNHDTVHAQWDDSPEVDEKRAKTEPPEDTKEFEELVHNAFLKFIKVLNENSANRKKYVEKGGTSIIKCCVCGSISKEFVNTQSLVMHAFLSGMVGLRAEHLGLHRALCLLMGWNSVTTSSGSWVPKMLPNAETLAMKEELIIWPPVVFIHNSSIANANSDDRLIVSIEELGAIIRGMGFSQGIDKVCRGKPANQSIMVVMFHGTFSGLQEAERLHQLYTENKHGRAEFQQIDSRSSGSGETQRRQADKVQTILFGYLGIADDLHKLDFETKRRCVVRSKKEIQAIADMRTRSFHMQ
ncbi:hypothetical protein SLE2022_354940 [Rubroshorea leprosula]